MSPILFELKDFKDFNSSTLLLVLVKTEDIYFKGHTNEVTSLVPNPADSSLLLSSDGIQINIWNLITGKLIKKFNRVKNF